MELIVLNDDQGRTQLLLNLDQVAVISFGNVGGSAIIRFAGVEGDDLWLEPDLSDRLRRELAFLDTTHAEADEATVLGGQNP